jgi:hypothetical protein
MALQTVLSDPFDAADLSSAYIRVIQINLALADDLGRVSFGVYRDEAARLAGKPPVATFDVPLLPHDQPAEGGRGAIPSMPAVLANCQAAYDQIRSTCYALAKAVFPELTQALDV